MKISSYKISNMGLLIGLSIILTRLASLRIAIGGVEGIRIGFGKLPIILGGIIFGPLAGGIIGAFSDILGYFINPIGAYMPHFTLTSALTGIIPVVVLHLISRKDEANIWELGIAITVGQVITSIILIPYFLHSLFGLPFKVIMPGFILGGAINIPLYTFIISLLFKRCYSIFSSNRI